jgi:hypothetical protein
MTKHIDWNNYYLAQVGGDYNYYRGSNFQRGYGLGGYAYQNGAGLGGMFRKFASWVMPILRKHALPSLQSGVKAIGREALDSAADVAKDIISGRDFKETVNKRLGTAIESLKDKAEQKLDGRGIKRKRNLKNLIILKKKKIVNHKDIFD